MGRRLRDKLPKVEFSDEQVTEGYWQQQLRERDARSKLRQREYADRTRGAKYSDIRSGDKVLLKQACDSKLYISYYIHIAFCVLWDRNSERKKK